MPPVPCNPAPQGADRRSRNGLTKEGTAISGRLLNLDTFAVQLLDTKEQLRSFVKSDLADVVAYLTSLRGQTPARP